MNRHHSFPYASYALGKAAQVRDAEILKHELRLNLVRTSHYPQSSHFLNRCDELRLLVFEEIPGWQHIGMPAEGVVLKPVAFWARGERNIGGVLPLIILTNSDEVELRYGSHPPKRIGPDHECFPHLPHSPVVVDRCHFSNAEPGLLGMSWKHGTVIGLINGELVAEARFAADAMTDGR